MHTNSIKKLTDRGMDQVNIHYMVSSKTYDGAFQVMDDMKNDPRLEKVNAIVFLGLKQKGRGKKYEAVTQEQYHELVTRCFNEGIRFGMDSCSAPAFLEAVKDSKNYDLYFQSVEDCREYSIQCLY